MSALGIWNNRYEGGPCYAACMETFTLYLFVYQATILLSQSAGKAATMPREESTMIRGETRLEECANVSLQSRWVLKLANCRE